MNLVIDPRPPLELLDGDLQLVIPVEEGVPPEVHVAEGLPRPDRHLLVGLMQRIAMAVEELDADTVVSMDNCTVRLDREGNQTLLTASLVIVRAVDGAVGALLKGEARAGRRIARYAVRWFTGTIRLDIP